MTVDKYAYDPETAKSEPDDDDDDDDELPPLASSALLSPQTITIEQTPLADGSIAVKASTTTPYVNGYRDVKIDHYLIPSSDVTSFDSQSQQPPSDDYLCRVEYRVLPPASASGLVPTNRDDHNIHPIDYDDDDDKSTASTVYTSNVTSDSISVADSLAARSRKRSSRHRRYGSGRYRTIIMMTAVVVFFVMVLCVSVVRDNDDDRTPPDSTPGDGPSPPPTMPPENIANVNDDDGGGGGGDGDGDGTGVHHHHRRHNHKSRTDVIDDGGEMEDVNAKNSTEVIDRNGTTTYAIS